MNNNDNGYNKAQRDYDRQLLPDDNMIDCPECDGEGTFNESNCCGAEIAMEDICMDCKEHCEQQKCENCNGTGEVDAEKGKQEAYEAYLENKADEARDERMIEERNSDMKIGSDIDKFTDKYTEGSDK